MISQNYRIASPQILRTFNKCKHTCNNNDPRSVIENFQVTFFFNVVWSLTIFFWGNMWKDTKLKRPALDIAAVVSDSQQR